MLLASFVLCGGGEVGDKCVIIWMAFGCKLFLYQILLSISTSLFNQTTHPFIVLYLLVFVVMIGCSLTKDHMLSMVVSHTPASMFIIKNTQSMNQ